MCDPSLTEIIRDTLDTQTSNNKLFYKQLSETIITTHWTKIWDIFTKQCLVNNSKYIVILTECLQDASLISINSFNLLIVYLQDTSLISLANILYRAGHLDEGVIVSHMALETSNSLPVSHFTIANIYAAKVCHSIERHSHRMGLYS